ncbi:MAG: CopG family transcriptional regulator [Actinobacteria bacterium]|nr:CopG family transcriptional regulator [Actinomycetota bacterium]
MEDKVIFRIDKESKDKFYNIARSEGKTGSFKIRELIASYVAENDLSVIIDDLWDRISEKISLKGFEIKDIEKTIKEIRSSR